MHKILQQEWTSIPISYTVCSKPWWIFFCVKDESNDCYEILHIWLHFGTNSKEKADLGECNRALNERWLHHRETREGNVTFPVLLDGPGHNSQRCLGIQHYVLFWTCPVTQYILWGNLSAGLSKKYSTTTKTRFCNFITGHMVDTFCILEYPQSMVTFKSLYIRHKLCTNNTGTAEMSRFSTWKNFKLFFL